MSKKLFFLLMLAAVLSVAGLIQGLGQGQGGRGEQLNLPDGPGKDILQSACTECHNLQMASGTGYNREEWGLTLERMITAGAIRTAISGSRQIPRATSENSIQRRAMLPNTNSPKAHAIRIHRFSIRRAHCSSPSKAPT